MYEPVESVAIDELSGQSHGEELYIYASVDLVNSTKYKYHFGNGWPDVFEKFSNRCRKFSAIT